MKYVFVFLISVYQKLISPLFVPTCRFVPTCSQYAKEVLLKYGLFKGFYLSSIRLLKCHPFHPGGPDPVP